MMVTRQITLSDFVGRKCAKAHSNNVVVVIDSDEETGQESLNVVSV